MEKRKRKKLFNSIEKRKKLKEGEREREKREGENFETMMQKTLLSSIIYPDYVRERVRVKAREREVAIYLKFSLLLLLLLKKTKFFPTQHKKNTNCSEKQAKTNHHQ